MINVNVIYDDIYDDVDIIAIPNELANEIDEIVRDFCLWVPPEDDNDYWIELDGEKYETIETENFLKWLNTNYCQDIEGAYIVVQHTSYNKEYPVIEF